VIDPETGEVIAECNDEITEKLLNTMKEKKVEAFEILFIDNINVSSSLRDTLVMDKIELSARRERNCRRPSRRKRCGKRIGKGVDRYL